MSILAKNTDKRTAFTCQNLQTHSIINPRKYFKSQNVCVLNFVHADDWLLSSCKN